MSMARSTPAQKPRGPANKISAMGAFMTTSLEEEGHPEDPGVGLEASIGIRGTAVGDVRPAVAGIEGGAVGDEEGRPGPGPEQEAEVGVDLADVQVGPAGEGGRLRIGHEPPEREEVIAERRAQAGEER